MADKYNTCIYNMSRVKAYSKVEGLCELIENVKILKASKTLNRDKAAGIKGVIRSDYGRSKS